MNQLRRAFSWIVNELGLVRLALLWGVAGIALLCLCPPWQWERQCWLRVASVGSIDVPDNVIVVPVVENGGHAFLFYPPPFSAVGEYHGARWIGDWRARIDFARLGVEVALVVAVTVIAVILAGYRRKDYPN